MDPISNLLIFLGTSMYLSYAYYKCYKYIAWKLKIL